MTAESEKTDSGVKLGSARPPDPQSLVCRGCIRMRNLADVVCGGLELCIQRGGTIKIRLHPAMATLVYPSLCAHCGLCTQHLAYFWWSISAKWW